MIGSIVYPRTTAPSVQAPSSLPSDLTKIVSDDARLFKGIHIPHWSYDSYTVTRYSGSRGEYYYVTETYTETVDGEKVTREHEVRYTEWYPVSGAFACIQRYLYQHKQFSAAAGSQPPRTLAARSTGPYNEQYVSGFRSELFQIDAEQALETAKSRMDPEIRQTIMAEIVGERPFSPPIKITLAVISAILLIILIVMAFQH